VIDWFARSLTPTGRAVLFSGPLGLMLAAISGWREFFVLGLGCLVATVFAMLWIARPQRLGVKRTLHPPKVTVGESSTGVVQVKNTTRRRVGQRLAEDVLGDQVVRMNLPAMAAGQSIEQPYIVPARKRGLFDVGPVRLTRADPLGLFRIVQGQGTVEQLWVRPRVRMMATVASGWAKDLDGPTSDIAPRGSAAFHALREYQFGDDLRHIHWRTSARRNQLMVRHFVDTRRSQELVMLDPRSEVYSEESFEEAVEIAASICVAAQTAGRELRLVLPSQAERAKDQRLIAIDRLALVDRIANATLADCFAEVRHAHGGASALVIVTGDADGDSLVAQARKVQRQGLVIVVRVVEGSKPAYSSIGGGRIVTVPSAEQSAGVWLEAVGRR
jgi:uncharacterized protein (DUF58 family)